MLSQCTLSKTRVSQHNMLIGRKRAAPEKDALNLLGRNKSSALRPAHRRVEGH